MHILMVTASLPYPPHQGGAIRSYGILQGLHNAGHTITLLSFNDPERNINVEKTPLVNYCDSIITVPFPKRKTRDRIHDVLLTTKADIAQRLESPEMHRQLQMLLESTSFDLVQFEGIEITGYIFDVKHVPAIYDSFNAEAALQKVIAQVDRHDLRRVPSAIYSEIQARRIEQFERDICEAAAAVIAVSEEDAEELRKFRKDSQTYVVPSGIFADDYANLDDKIELKSNALVFTGKMDYRPNVDAMTWFADQILPKITQKIDVNLYIVGQKSHQRLERLRMNPCINLTGWVPEIQPYLKAADVYVAPLRMGSGTRLKILEAMASGCAVVATSIAASGLKASAREHMIVTDDENTMAEAVMDLLGSPERREQLGQGARKYILANYDWSVLIPRLLDAYKDIGLG